MTDSITESIPVEASDVQEPASDAPSTEDLTQWDVLVGRVIGRWDHASLKIQPMDASPQRFDVGAKLCLDFKGERRLLEVISSEKQGKGVVCDVGLHTVEEAEALRSATLWIRRDMRPALPEGEFYLDELIGVRVQSESGEDLGEIQEVLETPAHNVYVTNVAMIPAHADFIVKTDWEQRILTVRDLPGLKTAD